jgi:glycogen debranching enzyme
MHVSELIELLQEMPQDAEVHFQYNYGDHWRTQVAPKVSEVYEGAVAYSSYHQMDKVVEFDYDDEDEEEAQGNSVVLIG